MFNRKHGIALILIFLPLMAVVGRPVQGTTFSKAIVTITFDDQKSGQRVLAADILKGVGLKATAFVIPTALTGIKDTMTRRDVTDLQNIYGWEIGSRGMTDKGLAATTCNTSDCYNYEIQQSQTNLTQMGLTVSSFAYPTGNSLVTNQNIRAVVEATYGGARQASSKNPPNIESAGVDIYRVSTNEVKGNNTVSDVEGWIDQAVTSKGWLVLSFKQILNQPGRGANTGVWLSADFNTVALYLQSKVQASTLQVTTFKGAIDIVNGLRGTTGGGTGGDGGKNGGLLGLLSIPLVVLGVALVSGLGIGLHHFNSKKKARRYYSGPTPAAK